MPSLFGMASDRSTSRFGRRRPYIVVGTLLLILGAFLLAAAGNVLLCVLGMLVWQFGSNAANASYQRLFTDRVAKDQRGEASGYMGLMTIIGNVGSLGLAAFLLADVNLTSTSGAIIRRGANLFYILTGIVLFVGMLITAVGVHEMQYRHTLTRAARAEGSALSRFRHWFAMHWIATWREFNFALVFVTRFAVMMGLTLFMTFIEYYFANVAHVTNFVQATAGVTVPSLVGAILSSFALGIYSDPARPAPVATLPTLSIALAPPPFLIAPGSFPP